MQRENISNAVDLVVDSLGHPSWLSDAGAIAFKCNDSLHGLRPDLDCNSNRSWLSFIATEDRDVAERHWSDRGLSTQIRMRVHLARTRKAPLLCELVANRLQASGHGAHWLFQALPQREETANGDELEQQITQLKGMLNFTPAYGWYASASGVLMWVGSRLASYLGIPETHALRIGQDIGNTWMSHLEFVHPDDHAGAVKDWAESLRTSTPHETRFRIPGANGIYRWFLIRAEPVFDRQGNVALWIGINVDIDDFLRADEELRSSKERLARATQIAAVSEMSASIAHEINQPLGAIAANSHAASTWLTANPPNLDRARVSIERIVRDSRAAAEVVQKMRSLFRKQAPSKQPVDILATAHQVVALLDSEIRKRAFRIELHIADGMPSVLVDAVQLQQVLINLITNAMDAMAGNEKRIVKLRALLREESVQIGVWDQGGGVADVERIFETFFTTKEKGMGIGLAVSRSIIEAHGGTLTVTNHNQGGAEFILCLPIPEEPWLLTEPNRNAKGNLAGKSPLGR